MTNEVSTSLTFQEKIRDRIRDSIGDLISNEELQKLVETGIHQTFFQQRPPLHTGYNNPDREPLMHELIKEIYLKEIQAHAEAQVKAFLAENSEQVEQMVKDVVQAGAGDAIISALNAMFQGSFFNLQSSVQLMLQQNRG